MSREDAVSREAALDPGTSFIVQAPAGSGKTELLTQRFLSLLGTVSLPEQIIAITFTRKAAAEMRQRVVETLRAAADPSATVPAHRERARALARRVLERSERLGWSLLAQCQRLRILTIDALNTSLARQLPVLSSGVVGVAIVDDATALYRQAARRTTECLDDAGELGAALGCLLELADNSLERLEVWLADALPQRDRWIRAFAHFEGRDPGTASREALEQVCLDRLARLAAIVPADLEQSVFDLLDRRGDDARGADERSPPGRLARWREAAAVLLTQQGEWRRRFMRRDGFPAGDEALRTALDGVVAACHETPGLRQQLAALAALPDADAGPGTGQSEALRALKPVLTRLLAELRVLFAERDTVDHTELALAARQALGAVDSPSDLLLALDRRIEHILVDEFQDTSHLQWDLLERLTAGWEAGDGRTLFLVGDPMQSIYRFRDADLSLFARARRDGIGEIRLVPIELTVNHRSAAELVDWVNSTFASIAAAGRDAAGGDSAGSGAADSGAGFCRAVAARGPAAGAGAVIHALPGNEDGEEIARIVGLVREEIGAEPTRSIGILVRSRTHLIGLRSALAAAGLPAHAVEIDSPADTQLGQDLIALTAALTHRGDRLAWLGVLRAPWCGLTWTDLHALAAGGAGQTIWQALADPARLETLSAGGAARARWLRDRLEHGFTLRATRTLGRWIRDCWLLLDGPACLADRESIELAERLFADLDLLGTAGDLDDPAALQARFARPRPGPDAPAESGIEIMTVHRAKGLEFDTVILPGLSRTTRGNSYNLLLIQDIELLSGARIGLLGATVPDDPLTRFLQALDRESEAEERERLLYVAATRARHRLHLVATIGANRAPRGGSLLATLWPAIEGTFALPDGDAGPAAGDGDAPASRFISLPLRRLERAEGPPLPIPGDDRNGEQAARPEFEWVHPASVQIGTLIHRELQRLASRAGAAAAPVPPAIEPARYRRELALLGVDAADLAEGAARVAEALERVWNDAVGRWILAPHAEAWSELRLTARRGNRLEHLRLDRSFVDGEGRRWIIDYKTGRHLGADVEQFLDAEVERYRDQLERYAAVVAVTDPRPIRVGLYFPLMTTLRDWTPAVSRAR